MSEAGIDAYRVASVLGYCLLPMVGVGAVSVMVALECVKHLVFVFCPNYLLQRLNRLSLVSHFGPMVHLCGIRNICGSPSHV